MQQVGDNLELQVTSPPGSVIYSYVWNFWDGSSTATVAPFVTKVVNIGGNPSSGELHYTCQPVAPDGQTTTLNGTLLANNPPVILPGASVSPNDAVYPYSGSLSLSALDLEGDVVSFAWYEQAAFLGAGVTINAGIASGTWAGNGVTVITSGTAYRNTFVAGVNSDATRDLTCYARDASGGTTTLDFILRGEPPTTLSATLSAGVSGLLVDASTLPTTVIGPGQTVSFTVFVNPLPGNQLTFAWSFAGSNGWSSLPVASAGTTTILENGGYRNSVVRDISAETVTAGTSKVVTADVRVLALNLSTGFSSYIDLQFDVVLVVNAPPTAVTINRQYANGTVISGHATPGALIEFSAVAADPNNECVDCFWQFYPPVGPSTLFLTGPKVVVDTTGYAGSNTLQGALTVTDRLGATLTTAVPVTTFS